jgi:hypothetical protein
VLRNGTLQDAFNLHFTLKLISQLVYPTPSVQLITIWMVNPVESEKCHEIEGSTRCDACKSCGAIVELDGCGHRFHSRCIFQWPIEKCEVCSAECKSVKIFRPLKKSSNTMARKGKWSADEHKYANLMIKQFQQGVLPLADGLHLRGFISNLLQCDPLRVTKKYSGHAIGKQNFFYQRRKAYCYNIHIKLQKRISSLRNHFYWHIRYRCKLGYQIDVQELKTAETDYWIREFIKFAKKIGQKIELPLSSVENYTISNLSSQNSISCENESVDEIDLGDLDLSQYSGFPNHAASSPVTDDSSSDFESISTSSPSSEYGTMSPLSFDEWNDEEFSYFPYFLNDMSVDDVNMAPSLTTSNQTTRRSLCEWVHEEEARWNKAMSVAAWSLSTPNISMSDCQ